MKKLSGKAVYKGIVLGPVTVFKENHQQVTRVKITAPEEEIARLKKAGQESARQLQKLYEKALKEAGESGAAIFEAHQMMLEDDLTPGETVQMDKEKILAFVTAHGSANSHTSILARMMNIPALIGVPLNLEEIHSGTQAVVDGFSGEVIFEPSEEICAAARKRIAEEQEKFMLLQTLKGKENMTLDGRKVNICANISGVGDVEDALENDAEGIGLFRSEFLYLGKSDYPTEEEQFQAYKQVVQTMAGKKVIIRTLDIGADKQAE